MVVTFEVEVDCYKEKNKEQVEEIKELKKKVRNPRLEQSTLEARVVKCV